jgi:Mg/Co/Ni transporter MgtE
MFQNLLIANRGEIACRIIRTARRMGLGSIAVFSDADETAQHVQMADEAIHIGAAPARESYLNIPAIIAAAMLINLLAAAAVGVLVPLALRRLDIDPALSAGVILTTFTDCIGFATLLGLGALFLT